MNDFSASALLDVNLKAESLWAAGTQSKMYQSNAQAAQAVLENQTATFRELDNKDKDLKVKVMWLNPCAITTADCEGNCEITEAIIDSEAKTYEFDMCQKTGFAVNRDTLRSTQYSEEEVYAKSLAMAIKRMDEWWAVQVLLKMKAYAGINVAPSPWTWSAGGMTTNVPTASWDLKMVANLIKQGVLNQFSNPYYVEKGDLFVPVKNAEFDAGNDTGKGDASRARELNMYFDMWNFAKAGITEDMFAIDASALAMKTHTKHPDTPMVLGGKVQQTIYTVASQILPGVKYDVFYTLTCQEVAVNGKTRTQYVDTWRLETNGMIAANPESCTVMVGGVDYRPNGIISYSQV